jgi:hypothetical protein
MITKLTRRQALAAIAGAAIAKPAAKTILSAAPYGQANTTINILALKVLRNQFVLAHAHGLKVGDVITISSTMQPHPERYTITEIS